MKKKNKIQDGLKRNLTVTKERLEVGMTIEYHGKNFVIRKINIEDRTMLGQEVE